jgi:hypothetical protein
MTKTIVVGFVGLLLAHTCVVFANSASRPPVLARAQQQVPHGGIGPDVWSPSEWIPFSAWVRSVVTTDGVQRVGMQGRYYRRSDGSTRSETGPENGPIRVIDIKNIAAKRAYLFRNGRWQSNPMQLRDGGYRPRKQRVDMLGLERHAEAISGFLVYKYTDAGGVVSFQAPDLNFFKLRTSYQETTQEFYDIQPGEQPDHLFEPPQGADVEEKPEVRGIIQNRPPAAQQR